jgi:hypothetical protein
MLTTPKQVTAVESYHKYGHGLKKCLLFSACSEYWNRCFNQVLQAIVTVGVSQEMFAGQIQYVAMFTFAAPAAKKYSEYCVSHHFVKVGIFNILD